MKILLLTDRMETGGAETHISNLAHGLRSLGHEVWLLSAGGSLADQLKASGIRCIHAQFSSRRPICLLKSLRILRKLIAQEHFDVIHAHARLPAFLLRFCRASRTRHVVSVHAEFHLNAILKRLCYWGFQTIAVSEDLRQYVCHEYRIPPERVQVIPNGIDCTTFMPPAPRLRKEAPSILFASRLDNDCAFGAFLLCEIAPSLCRRFPGVSISIAGGGSALETVKLHAEAANRIIGRPAIQLLGRVEDMAVYIVFWLWKLVDR